MERIAVSATYEAVKGGEAVAGSIEFVARVADPSKGLGLVTRTQRAVAHRLRVRLADMQILGVLSS